MFETNNAFIEQHQSGFFDPINNCRAPLYTEADIKSVHDQISHGDKLQLSFAIPALFFITAALLGYASKFVFTIAMMMVFLIMVLRFHNTKLHPVVKRVNDLGEIYQDWKAIRYYCIEGISLKDQLIAYLVSITRKGVADLRNSKGDRAYNYAKQLHERIMELGIIPFSVYTNFDLLVRMIEKENPS